MSDVGPQGVEEGRRKINARAAGHLSLSPFATGTGTSRSGSASLTSLEALIDNVEPAYDIVPTVQGDGFGLMGGEHQGLIGMQPCHGAI